MFDDQPQHLPDPAFFRLLSLAGRLFSGARPYLLLKPPGPGRFPVLLGSDGRVANLLSVDGNFLDRLAGRVRPGCFEPGLQEWAEKKGLSLLGGLPVSGGGLLLVAAPSAAKFSAADWSLLEDLAAQVAVILDRNRLEDADRAYHMEAEAMPAVTIETGVDLPDVADNLLELQCRIDSAGTIQSISSSAERLLGYMPGQLNGRDFVELVHPEERMLVMEAVQGESRAGAFEIEVRWRHHDGHYLYFDCRGGAVGDAGAGADGFFITGRNISRRKRAEAEVRRLETLFQLVWKNSRDAMRLIDGNGRVVEVNDAYCRLVEKPREELVGAPFVVAYSYPNPEVKLREFSERFAQRLIPSRLSLLVPLRTGVHRVFELSSSFFETERQTLLLTIYRDITDRRKQEAELKELNDALRVRASHLGALTLQLTRVEQAERRRLAQAVHDHLQQLLVAARMTMERVRRRLPDGETAETAAEVEELLVESIEASRSITVELSPPILHDGGLIAALEWLQRRMLEKHGLRVDLSVDREAEQVSEPIRLFLFQAVRELVFNSFKHAAVKEVTVTLEWTDRKRVCVTVADKGAGFEWELIRRGPGSHDCFGLFSLGERIDHIGGIMKVDTLPGEGTRVTLVVPVDPTVADPGLDERVFNRDRAGVADAGSPAVVPERETVPRIRLLLVDDHKIMRQGLRELLQDQPDMVIVGEAENGLEGITLAQQLQPDVVVMDLAMPVMNGIEATRVLAKELPGIKVIGLSMHVKEDMAKAMLDAGASAYVTKAMASESLSKTIRDCVGVASRI